MSEPGTWLRGRRALRVVLIALTFPLPFTNLLSGALVVLVTLLTGWRAAATDALWALLLVGAGLWLGGGAWTSPVTGALLLWGGGILGGHLLRLHGSVALAAQIVLAMALLGVVLAGLIGGDPVALWRPVLDQLLAQTGLAEQGALPPDWLDGLAGVMNGVVASSILASIFLAWLIGSWMAGRAEGRSYREAFVQLALGRVLAVLAVLVAVLGLVVFRTTAMNLLLVFGMGFACQGLAVVHWLAERRRWPRFWPVALYGPLLLTTPLTGMIVMTLATIGFIDNWYGLRRPPRDVV